MANIILKDKNGTDITHMGIDYLCMRTLEGGLVRFNEGDIRVISVDELPSENIKEDAIYKVSATDEDGNAKVVFYTYVDGEWTEYGVGKDPVFENLEITENGTYTPAEGVDGWNEVTVNVESNPVLTELVVTENGVYDEPVIGGGLEPITWDGNTDGKVTIHPADTFVFAKISDKVFSVDDYIGSTLTISDMSPMTVTSDSIMADDTYVNANGFVISILVPNAVVDGVVFPEVGTYVANMGGYRFISLTFAGGTPVPADGWNKVTVNVAGDIIDVDELPTENIEEGKIYRVTKESEPIIYVVANMTTEPVPITYLMEAFGVPLDELIFNTIVVDDLPDEMEVSDKNANKYYVYILSSTGIGYVTTDGTKDNAITFSKYFLDNEYDHGWIDSVDDMVRTAGIDMYTLRSQSSTTYGIPDEANNKTVFEHNGSEWVECGAGSGSGGGDNTVIDVESFPTENVDNEKIYRMTETIPGVQVVIPFDGGVVSLIDLLAEEIGVQLTLEVVAELPSSITMPTDGSFLGYILRESGEVYIFVDETTSMPLTQVLEVPFGGIISDVSEISSEAYYTIFGDDRLLISYGVPDANADRHVYEYTESDGWINASDAAETVKEYEPIVTSVKELKIEAWNEVVTLSCSGVRDYITDICVPTWVQSININLLNQIKNARRYENDRGFYWRNELCENSVLLESKLDKDVESVTISMPVRIVYGAFNDYASLKQIVFNDMITQIYGFNGCTSLESVTLPERLVSLDGFSRTTSLKSIVFPGGLRDFNSMSFFDTPDIEEISIDYPGPGTSVYVETGCLMRRSTKELLFGIKNATIPTDTRVICNYAFYRKFNHEELVLPDSVIEIRSRAFQYCSDILNVTLPSNVATIGYDAFYGCRGLTNVTFKGTPTSIGNNVFYDCINLTDIYVPWAEGAVAGAPWGATNATIHYNHTV